jgi:DNA-binding response OmpR family regulator
MNSQPQQRYNLGLSVGHGRPLLAAGRAAFSLTPKVFDLLELLVRNNGRLVERMNC